MTLEAFSALAGLATTVALAAAVWYYRRARNAALDLAQLAQARYFQANADLGSANRRIKALETARKIWQTAKREKDDTEASKVNDTDGAAAAGFLQNSVRPRSKP